MAKRVKDYQAAWTPSEKKILTAISKVLGVDFRQNVIDVYIAPWFHAISDTMIIGVMSEPDHFIDVLTHELLHRILTDNSIVSIDEGFDMADKWYELFGREHSLTTLVHIPVHALHKHVYLDVLKAPDRLERDMKMNTKNDLTEYTKSLGLCR